MRYADVTNKVRRLGQALRAQAFPKNRAPRARPQTPQTQIVKIPCLVRFVTKMINVTKR